MKEQITDLFNDKRANMERHIFVESMEGNELCFVYEYTYSDGSGKSKNFYIYEDDNKELFGGNVVEAVKPFMKGVDPWGDMIAFLKGKGVDVFVEIDEYGSLESSWSGDFE